jgi:hypothetical protein
MWQLIRPLDLSTSVNLARGGGGWCSAAREKLVNKVSWDRTERSVGKNCIIWSGRVDHNRDQSAVAQAEEIRLIGRLCIIGWFLGNGDTW